MKALCFLLDSAAPHRTAKAMLGGEWHCRRASAPRRFRRYYLDSLDWRLLKGARSLVANEMDGGFQLRLIDLRSNEVLVDAHAMHRPVFVPWPPSAALSAALSPLLGRRALVSHIQLTVTRHALSVHDSQGRALARLVLDLSEASRTDGDAARGRDRRLCMTPLAGHGKQHSALINTLSQQGQPVQGEVAPVAGLVTTLGIDAARFNAKPELLHHAKARADIAVKRLLGFFLSVIEAHREAVIADVDSDCLHDLRVAARRSRSLLRQARHVLPARRTEQARTFFTRLGQATNRQRDLDVMLLNFDLYRARLPVPARGRLDILYAWIVEQRRLALEDSTAFLRSADCARFMVDWRAYLATPPPRRSVLVRAAWSVERLAAARIWKAYKRVLAEGAAIDESSPPQALHELRKRCKTLRYLIECFASLYPAGKIERALKILKRLQDILGEYQDLHAHVLLLCEARALMDARGLLSPELNAAIGRITRALTAQADKHRSRFGGRFAIFGDAKWRRLFRQLFKS